MQFLAPAMLLWAIPATAAIIALYLFRLRRQQRRVSSLMLWGAALQEMQANAPFRRLRANLLMFLQIAAALALVISLARPFRVVPGVSANCVAVVLDASASMQATDVSPSRFARAKAEAASLIDGLGRTDQMCLVVAGTPTRVAAPLTSDKSVLREALNTVTITDCPARGDEAVRVGLSLIRGRRGGKVVVLSDGGFPRMEVPAAASAISLVRIGAGDDNVGIIALDSRVASDGRSLVLATVRNFSRRERTFDVEIRADSRLVDVQPLRLLAEQEQSRVFTVPRGATTVGLRLDVKDRFAPDNQAYLRIGPGKQYRGLLLTKGNVFLQMALALDPHVSFVRSATGEIPAGQTYDVYVFDRVRPAKLPARGAFMFIAVAGDGAPVRETGALPHPQVTRADGSHPLARAVNFSSITIEQARAAQPLDWAKPVVFARETPLVVAGERGSNRSVYVGWNLLDSDFALRVGFPIFISNCMDWLTRESGGTVVANLRAGEVLSLNPPARDHIEVRGPDATQQVPVQDGTAALRLERVGLYETRVGKYRALAAANLLDTTESDIRPRAALDLAGAKVAAVGTHPRQTREYWRWAALAILALLTVEWLAYHRRI